MSQGEDRYHRERARLFNNYVGMLSITEDRKLRPTHLHMTVEDAHFFGLFDREGDDESDEIED